MKLKEKYEAIEMRKSGESIPIIAEKLNVSKGSVSRWVRDIRLSTEVLEVIRERSHSDVAVEKRRLSRIASENQKRNLIVALGRKKIKRLSKQELFILAIALYWGEGSKKKRGVFEFTNSDPAMISAMKQFLVSFCKVPDEKFRGHVYLHNHIEPKNAERYWSEVSGIPTSQFHKTSIQKNTRRIHRDTLPFGTFAILVCDTKLKLTMDGWIDGIARQFLD